MTHSLRSLWTAACRLVVVLLFSSLSVRAQAPAWQSALTAPGGNGDVYGTALDAAGNVYLAGVFYGSLTFGSTTLMDAGYGDIFVAKWSPATNTFLWAKRAGGTGYDSATGIAINGTAIYLTGSFESPSAAFGSTTIQNVQPATVPFNFRSDGYVAKLTDTGTNASFGWAQQFGGPGFDMASAVVASGTTLYLAGRHGAPSATFGGITVANSSSGTQFNTDLFVAKLTDTGSAGSFVWVQPGGGSSADYAATLALSGSNLYVGGAIQNYAYLGSNMLSAPGCTSGFVAKLADNGSSGSFVWAQLLGGSQQFNTSTTTAVAVSGASVYATGNFDGIGAFGNQQLTSAGFADVFVAKLTDSGSSAFLNWAQRAGGQGFDGANALAVIGNGVYVVGGFLSPTAAFGSTSLTNINPTTTASSGSPDIFLTRLTDTGNFSWTMQAGSIYADLGLSLASNGSTLYLGGGVGIPGTFGSFQLNGPIPYRQPVIATVATTTLGTMSAIGRPIGHAYPNPARTSVTVPLPAATGTSQGVLTLTNSVGQVVRTQAVTLTAAPSDHQLDLGTLPAGLYTLLVRAGSSTTAEKLVID